MPYPSRGNLLDREPQWTLLTIIQNPRAESLRLNSPPSRHPLSRPPPTRFPPTNSKQPQHEIFSNCHQRTPFSSTWCLQKHNLLRCITAEIASSFLCHSQLLDHFATSSYSSPGLVCLPSRYKILPMLSHTHTLSLSPGSSPSPNSTPTHPQFFCSVEFPLLCQKCLINHSHLRFPQDASLASKTCPN